MREIKFRAWNRFMKRMEATREFDATDYPVMQFTGLFDISGKEIYEGDIIRMDKNCLLDQGYVTRTVGFKDGCFVSIESRCNLVTIVNGFRPVVIGNIHENPELLELAP